MVEASHNEPFRMCLKGCLATGFRVLIFVVAAVAFALTLWITSPKLWLAWGITVALGGIAALGTLWSCLLVCGIERFVRSLLP